MNARSQCMVAFHQASRRLFSSVLKVTYHPSSDQRIACPHQQDPDNKLAVPLLARGGEHCRRHATLIRAVVFMMYCDRYEGFNSAALTNGSDTSHQALEVKSLWGTSRAPTGQSSCRPSPKNTSSCCKGSFCIRINLNSLDGKLTPLVPHQVQWDAGHGSGKCVQAWQLPHMQQRHAAAKQSSLSQMLSQKLMF